MAELVQRELEKMVDSLEELRTSGILSPEEVKMIIKSRREYEYEIRSNAKQLIDFIRYIEYELNLYYLIEKRKKRIKGCKITHNCLKKVISLFETALMKWRGDKSLWFLYEEFLVRSGNGNALNRVIASSIRYIPNFVPFWIMGASWEFFHNDNISSARILLQRANRLNPHNENIFLEYARLELAYRRHLEFKLEINLENEQIPLEDDEGDFDGPEGLGVLENTCKELDGKKNLFLEGGIPLAIYYSAIKVFPNDLNLRIKFARIFYAFPNTDHLVDLIMKSIEQDFESDQMAQGYLATRPYYFAIRDDYSGDDANRETNYFIRIAECISNMDSCIASFSGECEGFYEFYLNFLIKMKNKFDPKIHKTNENKKIFQFVYKKMISVFEDAIARSYINENMALLWINALLDEGSVEPLFSTCKKLYQILSRNPRIALILFGLMELSNANVEGWNGNDEKERTLVDFIEKMDESHPYSHRLILYYIKWKLNVTDGLASFFDGLLSDFLKLVVERLPGRQCIQLKLELVELLIQLVKNGANSEYSVVIRKFLDGPFLYPPNDLEVYIGMVEIENYLSDESSRNRARVLFERAIREYGRDGMEVWTQAIKWERNLGNFERVNELYRRATKELKNPDQFVEQMTLEVNGG